MSILPYLVPVALFSLWSLYCVLSVPEFWIDLPDWCYQESK